VNIKGKTRKDEKFQCRYGPDGKVEKTPVGPPPEQPKEQPHGLKGKGVEKKVGEMKDYMDRLKSLISHYAPPDSQRIQEAKEGGRVKSETTGGVATITVQDYYKAGDQVAFGFNSSHHFRTEPTIFSRQLSRRKRNRFKLLPRIRVTVGPNELVPMQDVLHKSGIIVKYH